MLCCSGDSRLVSGDIELSHSDAQACLLDMFAFSNALSSSGYSILSLVLGGSWNSGKWLFVVIFWKRLWPSN